MCCGFCFVSLRNAGFFHFKHIRALDPPEQCPVMQLGGVKTRGGRGAAESAKLKEV